MPTATTPTPPLLLIPPSGGSFVERFEFLTDVFTAYDGSEGVRQALRAFPRMSFDYNFVLSTDEERTAFEPLLANERVLLPLYCHAFRWSQGTPPLVDAVFGSNFARPLLVANQDGSRERRDFFIYQGRIDFRSGGYRPGDLVAWPLVEARLDTESIEVEHPSPVITTLSATFKAYDFDETSPSWGGPESLGLPLLTENNNFRAAVSETLSFSANTFDAGHLTSFEVRHRKRAVSVLITLTDRQAVAQFRRFIRAVRGRAGAFRWECPLGRMADRSESTWRLASDTVELNYYNPSLAECSLRFVELT